MTLPLLFPLLLEAVLGTTAHVPVSMSAAAAVLIAACVLVFTVRERRALNRHSES